MVRSGRDGTSGESGGHGTSARSFRVRLNGSPSRLHVQSPVLTSILDLTGDNSILLVDAKGGRLLFHLSNSTSFYLLFYITVMMYVGVFSYVY